MKRSQSLLRLAVFLSLLGIAGSSIGEASAPDAKSSGQKQPNKTNVVQSRTRQTSTTASTPRTVTAPDPSPTGSTTASTPVQPPLRERIPLALAPNTGEQIKWQVISGGGVRATSTSYILTGTVGQTAAGPVSSTNYKVNQGFWQNFTSSCCVGKRGNVNNTGITDSADLAALVSYLTGGGFVLPCYDAANVNGVGIVDSADLAALVSYLTGGGFVLPNCP